MLEWEILAAQWAVGELSVDEVVSIADRELKRGSSSLHWMRIVGEPSPTRFDIEPEFRRALHDLGVRVPEAHAAGGILSSKLIERARLEFDKSNFVEPWGAFLDADRAASRVRQLELEVSSGHQLFGVPARAVAHRQDRDDSLFELLDGSGRVAVVHLTYGGRQQPPLPDAVIFESLAQWRERAWRDTVDHLGQ
ncbi:MAG: hypothetical protein DHS20C21_02890 [Gemmatimonadota bacterium]|nr:MAG: hypothetical protein DHS20C21_02890 [Gemmatimonadota bacterium]